MPEQATVPSRKTPTRQQLEEARDRTIPDVIGPDLALLFVGINPSLYSAAVGHHFARPGNRFYPALEAAGITDRRLEPDEDQQLLQFGCGITNLVARATARADELSADELTRGLQPLKKKVRRYRPRCVVFLGVTAYRTATKRRDVTVGPQEEEFGTDVWVLPNPSGLNAHYKPADFARLFRQAWAAAGDKASRRAQARG